MGEQDWFNRDFYAILGVDKGADGDVIKKAYRKLARKWHPDQNPGDVKAEEKFKEIGEAYAILSDPEQRERYDSIRAMASGGPRFASGSGPGTGGFEDLFGGMYGGRSGGPNIQFQSSGEGGFEDIFSSLFAGAAPGGRGGFGGPGYQRSPQASRGQDITASTTISFRESYEGATLKIAIEGRSFSVRIPAGVRDGQKIKLRGKGHPGVAGGPAGDLVVKVLVRSDSRYVWDGNTLRVKLPVSVPEAMLGAKVQVELPDETTVAIKVPAGSSSGTVMRLRGRGLKKGNKRGDVIVELAVMVPPKPSKEVKAAAEALKEALGDWEPRAEAEEVRS